MISVIFDWGVYAVPAFDDTKIASKRKIQNGSEWYLARLIEKSTFRPVSGWKETQSYHNLKFKNNTYEDFANKFTCKNLDFDKWMEVAQSIGAIYVILTARHHDGYCLWDTNSTPFNSCKTGPKIDLVKKFKESALAHGLKFGLYYSWFEFGQSFTKKYVDTITQIQMNELINLYLPDMWFFDGDWTITTKYAKEKINIIIEKIKEKNCNSQINDRICFSNSSWIDTIFTFWTCVLFCIAKNIFHTEYRSNAKLRSHCGEHNRCG